MVPESLHQKELIRIHYLWNDAKRELREKSRQVADMEMMHYEALESQSRANMVAIDSDLADLLRSKADFRFPLSPCRDDSGDCVPGVHLVDMSESRVEAVDDFAE